MFVYVVLCITLCPFKFWNHLDEEEKSGCFAIIVLQMYCYYNCSVALPFGRSAVYDCGIHTHLLFGLGALIGAFPGPTHLIS